MSCQILNALSIWLTDPSVAMSVTQMSGLEAAIPHSTNMYSLCLCFVYYAFMCYVSMCYVCCIIKVVPSTKLHSRQVITVSIVFVTTCLV